MRIVIDTNVFVSGIFWTGASHQVLLWWKNKKFVLLTSVDTISEIIRILEDFKIKLPEEMLNEWIELLTKNSLLAAPKEKLRVIKDDPKDDIFIELAVFWEGRLYCFPR